MGSAASILFPNKTTADVISGNSTPIAGSNQVWIYFQALSQGLSPNAVNVSSSVWVRFNSTDLISINLPPGNPNIGIVFPNAQVIQNTITNLGIVVNTNYYYPNSNAGGVTLLVPPQNIIGQISSAPPTSSCTYNSQCPPGQMCNPTTGMCSSGLGGSVQICNTNSGCSNGQICISGLCGPCTTNSQCPAGQVCFNGQCAQATNPSNQLPLGGSGSSSLGTIKHFHYFMTQ